LATRMLPASNALEMMRDIGPSWALALFGRADSAPVRMRQTWFDLG
jgi:hypothetical protein